MWVNLEIKKMHPCSVTIKSIETGTISMNTQVTATGMIVKAQAEGGIVISNSAKTSWTATSTAQVTSATLFPTSHAKSSTGTWYHNKSDNANDAKAGQPTASYEALSTALSSTTEGVGYVEKSSPANSQWDAGIDAAYYLMNNFFIKSSGDVLTATTLYINEVTVASSDTLLAIDAALRVLIIVDDKPYLYAPVSITSATPTLNYRVANQTDTVALAGTVKNTATEVTTIGNTDADAISIQIYVFFEGEDANCKSTNISGITTDELTVSVKFGTTTV